MKKLLLVAFAALIVSPAMAADQAVRVHKHPRPVVLAVQAYTWTGFYVGGNVGYSWGDARTDTAGSATSVTDFGFPGVIPNPPVAFAGSQTQRLNGVIGGGQIGYNFQFSPRWVLGFEADIQGSRERGSFTSANPLPGTVCTEAVTPPFSCALTGTLNGAAVTAYDAKIAWFGTVRGRLGVLISDQVLLYGTGGLAYGRVELSGVTNVNGSVTFPPQQGGFTQRFASPGTTAFGASSTRVGFAVGGGVEGKCSYWLPAGWTWKLEYLYVDLGSLDTLGPFPAASVFFGGPFTGTLTTHTHFTDNIVRVGLNYKFGNYYAPVVTK